MANVTRNLIRVEFLKLLRNNNYDSIKTADIAKECEINRNTFYYHFKNKDELLDYILDEEERKVISFKPSDKGLVSVYVECMDFLRKNKIAFSNLYYSSKRDQLLDYLESITDTIIYKYIGNTLPEIDLSNKDVEMIVKFVSTAFMSNLVCRIRNTSDKSLPIFTGKSQEFFDEFIIPALKKANSM